MKEIGGILIAFLAVLGFLQLKSCSEKSGREQAMHRIQLEREATQQRSYGPGNVGAIDATKDVAEKIAAVAPLVMDALQECTDPIPPEQITSHLENETNFCPGLPIRKCPTSSAGATTPTGLMPATIKQFAKPGEDPETMAVALKITVRHLCFARGKGNIKLDPASDAAILRYNASTKYLNDIRATQARHKPIWASIQSGNGPMMATGTVSAPSGSLEQTITFPDLPGLVFAYAVLADGTRTINPLPIGHGFTSSVTGQDRDDGARTHKGNDEAAAEGEPLYACADGVITAAGWHHDKDAKGNPGLGEIAGIHVGIAVNTDKRVNDTMAGCSCMHMLNVMVKPGDKVKMGQLIGHVGKTAVYNSGSHLHFQVYAWDNSKPKIEPVPARFIVTKYHDPSSSAYRGPSNGTVDSYRKKLVAMLGQSTR